MLRCFRKRVLTSLSLSYSHYVLSFSIMSAIQKENILCLNVVSFCRLGVLACYLDPLDLGSYLQDSAVSSALWQQLAQCMNKGFISDSGRVSRAC